MRKKKVDTMSASRFTFPTSPKVDEMKRKVIPKNTDKCTQWVEPLGMFDVSVSYSIYYMYHVFLYMATIRPSSLDISPWLRLELISQGSDVVY